MKTYPSIPILNLDNIIGKEVFVQEKNDGSNLRVEWNPKKGFYKFGTRTQMISLNEPIYGEGIKLFLDTSEKLDKYLRSKKVLSAITFFEMYGVNSFAGIHIDEPKKIDIFDISLYKKGFISPEELDSIDIPNKVKLIYKGLFTNELYTKIRNGEIGTKEGVIIKWVDKGLHAAKLKNIIWLNKVKEKFGLNKYIEENGNN